MRSTDNEPRSGRSAYYRAYYAANRENCLERQRAYREANPEKYRAYRAAWRAANWEKRLAYMIANKERIREKRLANGQQAKDLASLRQKKYGITAAQYQTMLLAQGGVCLICCGTNENGRQLAVDHCHRTGRVRGLLCRKCNTALGMFSEDPSRLRAAAAYLESNIGQEANGSA